MFLEIAPKVKSEIICKFQLCFILLVSLSVDTRLMVTTLPQQNLNLNWIKIFQAVRLYLLS